MWELPILDDKYLTAFDVRDMGMAAVQIFQNPQKFDGQKINMASEHMHPQDFIIKLGLISRVPTKVILTAPPNDSNEMTQMFTYFSEYPYFGKSDWQTGQRFFPQMKTWEQFVHSQTTSPAEAL